MIRLISISPTETIENHLHSSTAITEDVIGHNEFFQYSGMNYMCRFKLDTHNK